MAIAENRTTERALRTVNEVADFLSVSRSKVYSMMDDGDLPYVKFGKSRRVVWDDVLRLIEQSIVGRE